MVSMRSSGGNRPSDVLTYDPHRLSSPRIVVMSMLVFLAIVAFIAAILTRQISSAFSTNPGLNGLILGVLVVGIAAVVPADDQAFPRGALGEFVPRRFGSHRPGAARADEGVAVALGDDGLLDQFDAHDAGFDRQPPRRKPRHFALPDRPARLPRPARHLLGPAGNDRLDRRDDPVARSRAPATRRPCSMR